ncbi:MAG TPA: TerB family tellurite resistance protein [Usitatibacter sp.]|nr:TerB family tellurite resistance protein [Usitatibacter sp.]
MLAAIRDFFEKNLAQPSPGPKEHTLELAAATLLAEVARLDGEITPAEREAVLAAIRSRFHLSGEQASSLFSLAEAEAKEATDYFQFTSLIREHFGQEDRQHLIELMWRAAYADEVLSAHEQHLVRKIADLLYVPHSAYIAAKMRAKEQVEGQRGKGKEGRV